jgi:opacity protein-like surface antigen
MKKTIILLALLAACIPVTARAQGAAASPWVAGFDLRGNLPMGDFKDFASFGFGGTAYAGYSFSPAFAVTARTGYIFTGGKDIEISQGGATGTITTNYGIVPVVGGLRFFFNEGDTRFYVAGEAGLYLLSATQETKNSLGSSINSASSSQSKFGYAPAVGAQFRASYNMMVDARIDYTAIPMDAENAENDKGDLSWMTFAVGLEWTL